MIRVDDNGKGMTGEQYSAVVRKLEQPRRKELEEYYGALAGESMAGTGMSLVGMLKTVLKLLRFSKKVQRLPSIVKFIKDSCL